MFEQDEKKGTKSISIKVFVTAVVPTQSYSWWGTYHMRDKNISGNIILLECSIFDIEILFVFYLNIHTTNIINMNIKM